VSAVQQQCLFCDGDPSAPDHGQHCDGRQGHVEAATYPERAGWTEPTTSREAAESVDASTLRAAVRECLGEHGAMTADECAAQLRESVLAVRPRFSELRALGEIADTGERHLNRSGKRAVVWSKLPKAGGGDPAGE
jgi:hypothetical protein